MESLESPDCSCGLFTSASFLNYDDASPPLCRYDGMSGCEFALHTDYDEFDPFVLVSISPTWSREYSFCSGTWTDPLEGGRQYSYRARWYLPEGGTFAERDPVGYGDSGDLYQFVGLDPGNVRDPLGTSNRGNLEQLAFERGKKQRALGTVGIGVEFFGAVGVPHRQEKKDPQDSWLEETFSGVGVLEGASCQFWARPDGSILAALFLYDSVNGVLTNRWRRGDAGPFGPSGVFGDGASFGVEVNIAVYKGPEPNGHWDLTDRKVVESWAGMFGGVSVAAGPISVGGFWSPTYSGISVGGGVGFGVAFSITDYRPVWTRVYHIANGITAIRRFVQDSWLGLNYMKAKLTRNAAAALDHQITVHVGKFRKLLND